MTLVPMAKIAYSLAAFTKADIAHEVDFLGGRWGSFWDLGAEIEIVKSSRWWIQNLRQLIRRFARTHPEIQDTKTAYKTIKAMPGDPVTALYNEMMGKWPKHAWSDTDVRDGHLYDDLLAALAEVYG